MFRLYYIMSDLLLATHDILFPHTKVDEWRVALGTCRWWRKYVERRREWVALALLPTCALALSRLSRCYLPLVRTHPHPGTGVGCTRAAHGFLPRAQGRGRLAEEAAKARSRQQERCPSPPLLIRPCPPPRRLPLIPSSPSTIHGRGTCIRQ
jgi:hypothetical protein